jgi:nucleoside-diphosphate-sugar epimerase
MKNTVTNHQDVAEPDQMASGTTGTGLENKKPIRAGRDRTDPAGPTRFRPAEQRVARGGNAKITCLGWKPSRGSDDALAEIFDEWKKENGKWLSRL